MYRNILVIGNNKSLKRCIKKEANEEVELHWMWFCVVVMDMDGRIYVRPWQGGVLSGGFEKNPKPIFTEGRNHLEIQNMQEDWDHFGESSFVMRLIHFRVCGCFHVCSVHFGV